MKGIAAIFFSLIAMSAIAKNYSVGNLINESPSYLDKCKIQNFDVVGSDNRLSSLVTVYLNKFGGLQLKDFDKGTCVKSENIKNGVFTSYFYQQDKSIVGQNLKMFLAYSESNSKILLVLRDNNMQTFVLGNDLQLFDALKETYANNPMFSNVDKNSKLNFTDLGGEKLIKIEKEQAAKVKAEKDEIRTNAQKALNNNSKQNLLTKNITYKLLLKSGEEDKPYNATVNVELDSSANLPLNKKYLEKNINQLSEIAQLNLKNPYSYIPRKVSVVQEGDNLKITMQYTAKNPVGGEVVGYVDALFVLKSNGDYAYERHSGY